MILEEIFEKPANFPISNISRDWNYHTSNTSTEISLSPKGISSLNKEKKKKGKNRSFILGYIRDIYIYIRFLLRRWSFFYTEWNNVTWEFFLDSRAREASTRGRKIIYHASKHRCDSYPTPPFEPLTLLIACSLISRFNNFSRPFPCAAADNSGIHLHRFSRGCAFEGKLERGETKR